MDVQSLIKMNIDDLEDGSNYPFANKGQERVMENVSTHWKQMLCCRFRSAESEVVIWLQGDIE